EEKTRRRLHLPVRLRTGNLAEAGRGGKRRSRSRSRGGEGTARRLEVGVVDDVERIDTKLESKAFVDLEVLGHRGIEIQFSGRPVRIASDVTEPGRDNLCAYSVDGVVNGPGRGESKA